MTDKPEAANKVIDWYALKLNEWLSLDHRSIVTRVPGGWIYDCESGVCFIPFNNEFEPRGVADDITF